MGTTFYMLTENKETAEKYMHGVYTLTDAPWWGYTIEIAKTSVGWKPLFHAYPNIKSVVDLKALYATGAYTIYDEYYTVYTWEQFAVRVLQYNKDNVEALCHILPKKFSTQDKIKGVPAVDIYGNSFPYKNFYADDMGFEFYSMESSYV